MALLAVTLAVAVTNVKKPQRVETEAAPPEEETTLEGTLYVLHEDDFANKKSQEKFTLKTREGRWELLNAAGIRVPSGSQVKVKGKKKDQTLELSKDGSGASQVELVSSYSANTVGAKKAAVILLNFSNTAVTSPTQSDIAGRMGEVQSYYSEGSFNQFALSADVYPVSGRYKLPIASSDSGACDLDSIGKYATQAADPDINYLNYQYLIFVYPGSCGYAGVAWIGGSPGYSTAEGFISYPTAGIINGYFGLSVVGHELGHNLTAYHANSWECGGSQVALTGCTTIDYGDLWDIMGQYGANHLSVYHKQLFGWLPSANILTVSQPGQYTIYPLETASSQPQAIRIARDSSTWYYFENRTRSGFDSNLPDSAVSGGLVHLAPPRYGTGDTHLIDINPVVGGSDFYDAGLSVGQRFVDTAKNLTVTATSKDNNALVLDVQFQTSTTPLPTPKTSPSPAPTPAGDDTTPPTVGFISPTNGATITKTATVNVNATDNVKVSHVIFYVDGYTLGMDFDPKGGWKVQFRPSRYPLLPGPHVLAAEAYDSSANKTRATITIFTQ